MAVELPTRVTNSWIQEEAPKQGTQKEAAEFLQALHDRGWSPDDIDERVKQHLPEGVQKVADEHRARIEKEKADKQAEKQKAREEAAAKREAEQKAAADAKAEGGNGGSGSSKAALEDLAAQK